MTHDVHEMLQATATVRGASSDSAGTAAAPSAVEHERALARQRARPTNSSTKRSHHARGGVAAAPKSRQAASKNGVAAAHRSNASWAMRRSSITWYLIITFTACRAWRSGRS